MNFLAHLHLAGPSDESLVGNLLGDFVKGRPETLAGLYPEGVITGIRQHRAIDRFTDSHPSFRRAKALLAPHRRRLGGIVVDVFYDHLLSRQWPGGHAERRDFIAGCHKTLLAREEWMPGNFRAILPRMVSENWLDCYSTQEGMALTFRRVATRSAAVAGILGAEEDFMENEAEFQSIFGEFLPDLMGFSSEWLEREG